MPAPHVALWNRALQTYGDHAHTSAPQYWPNPDIAFPEGYAFTDVIQKMVLNDMDSAVHDLIEQREEDERTAHPMHLIRFNDDMVLAASDPERLNQIRAVIETELAKIGLTAASKKKEQFQLGPVVEPYWYAHGNGKDTTEFANHVFAHDIEHDQLDGSVLYMTYMDHISPDRFWKNRIPPQPLFNYVINRMGKRGITINTGHIPALLREHPEKLSQILVYCQRIRSYKPDGSTHHPTVEQQQFWQRAISLIATEVARPETPDYNRYLFLRFVNATYAVDQRAIDTNTLHTIRHTLRRCACPLVTAEMGLFTKQTQQAIGPQRVAPKSVPDN